MLHSSKKKLNPSCQQRVGKREGKTRKFYLLIHEDATVENINNTQSIVKVSSVNKADIGRTKPLGT